MNYDIQFDGTKYAISVQNIDRPLAMSIMELIEGLKAEKPQPYGTVRDETERACRLGGDNIINCIKELRFRTSMGLKESKDCVDYCKGRTSFEPTYYNNKIGDNN